MSGEVSDKRGFSWNGKTLLSGIDPAGRAERVVEALPVMDRTLYLCPSPLYGYGLERLLTRLSGFSHSAVLCIEAEPELFALSQEHFDTALYNNPQLRITNRYDAGALCTLMRQEWGPRFFRRVETVRLNGGWQLHSALYDTLEEALRREIALDWGNAMTLTKLGRRYIRNALRNLPLIPRCYSLDALSFGSAPVLVLGAGPSLDHTLDGLQSHFGRALNKPEERPFRIVCVDTCLSALKERDIKPDLTVILESQHWNLADFTGLSGWDVPAALDLSALPQSASVLTGGLFLFFTPWTDLSIFKRLEAAGLLPARLPPLGSVGLSAALIARRLTQGTIIAAGLDFSFTLDAYHARSTPGHKSKLCRHSRLSSLLNSEAAFGKAVLPAVSKTGAQVLSNPAMRNYRDLFEREFGDSSGNDTARFYDISSDKPTTGLPLGIKTLSPQAAFEALSAGNIADSNKLELLPQADAAVGNVAKGNSALTEKLQAFIRKSGLIPRSSAPSVINKNFEIFGIKPDVIINFLSNEPPFQYNPVLQIPQSSALRRLIRDEQNRLTLLRDMLTGASAMDSDTLLALIDECDYLWAHFPDYAAADRRPDKAEFEAGSATAISFLKRLRVEIDPFLKLWDLIATNAPEMYA